MIGFTKERIEQFIKNPLEHGLTRSEQMEMARQLLASMEQEPVACIDRANMDYLESGAGADVWPASEADSDDVLLYAAPQLPQPAVVVSEAQSKKLFDEWSGGDGALGDLRASGVPDEFISMLKEFSLATWEACREAMLKHSAPFIVTSDHRMMEMPKVEDIDAVAAMLQGADPVTTANKLPFEKWLSQQTGTIDVECGCVMTEVFFHWLRVAYEAGNSPVIPDGWVMVPEEPTHEMLEAGDEQFGTYDVYRRMIAASPQQEVK